MSNPISTLHQAARAFAEAGIPIFPCIVDGKKPACTNGFKDATTDLGQIDAWWSEADYNLAMCPHDAGWAAVDIETAGLPQWAMLVFEHGSPDTYVVTTPRGGQHWYYAGDLPSTVRKLEPGQPIDTRGIGGYVLVPPSVVDGKSYEVLHDRDIAPLPDWIKARVATRFERAGSSGAELDLPGNVARARDLLGASVRRGDVAIEFRGGNNRTYQLACDVLNLGLSPELAWSSLAELWNPHCQPPWDESELKSIVDNAAAYAQNEAGAWAVAPAATTFASALDKLSVSPREHRSRFYLENQEEQDIGTDPQWIIRNLIQEATTVLMVGATQSYKSFLALDLALGISHGCETFGTTPLQAATVYAALEGRSNIKRARRRAWRTARNPNSDIHSNPFFVTCAPMVGIPEQVQEFGDEITKRLGKRSPKLIILDTVSKCMAGLNENDARDANIFIRFCDSLVETFGCSVLAIHHTGKDADRGARGSSAFLAGFDTVLEVKASRPTKAVEVWVRKHKDAEEPEKPWTFEGRAVGQSLVFFPTTASEHHQLTASEDIYEPRKIGLALQKLNAYGDATVTTTVLARQLTEQAENETEEQHQANVQRCSRALGALSGKRLAPYCERKGRDLAWSLPAPKTDS